MRGMKTRFLVFFMCTAGALFAAPAGDDCESRFEIQNAKLVTYAISGDTEETLRGEMKRRGPRGYHGYTEWFFTWNCRDISVTCTVTMPRWEHDAADPGLKSKYCDYWNRLARHEQGHVDIVTGNLAAARSGVQKMDCIKAALVFTRMMKKVSAESEKYDADTDHGVKQGAVF
jgi:predicted secreted Zn-dependent protease